MTLDEKLEELGYELIYPHCKYSNYLSKYLKHYDDINISVAIVLKLERDIADYGIYTDDADLYKQNDIDNMQVAFNRLKRDIKKIKKREKEKTKYRIIIRARGDHRYQYHYLNLLETLSRENKKTKKNNKKRKVEK